MDPQVLCEIQTDEFAPPGFVEGLFEVEAPGDWTLFDCIEDALEQEVELTAGLLKEDYASTLDFQYVSDEQARSNNLEFLRLRRDWKAIHTPCGEWGIPDVPCHVPILSRNAREILDLIRQPDDAELAGASPTLPPAVDDELLPTAGNHGQAGEITKPGVTDAVYLGKGRLRIGTDTMVFEGQQEMVLEALVELQAATKTQLEIKSGVSDAVRILKRLVAKHSSLKAYVTIPGTRGAGGYQTSIRCKSG